jgi:CubicO group peptidase (beta-lactamase class C family)
LKKNLYAPLGLKTITYHPLTIYPKNRIVPTEMDNSWRFGYLHGYVHDPSAALMGGMAGNAGLFSNAHDLGVLFQMVLNKGSYGGIEYLKPDVVEKFTKRFDDTQRGLGFDMPNLKAAVGKKAPESTYGHTGYTGTCVWVDPENKLVYVFLSNRNHPNSKNWKLNTNKIRERVHDAIYSSFKPENFNQVRK